MDKELAGLISSGRLFQRVWARTENAQSPSVFSRETAEQLVGPRLRLGLGSEAVRRSEMYFWCRVLAVHKTSQRNEQLFLFLLPLLLFYSINTLPNLMSRPYFTIIRAIDGRAATKQGENKTNQQLLFFFFFNSKPIWSLTFIFYFFPS